MLSTLRGLRTSALATGGSCFSLSSINSAARFLLTCNSKIFVLHLKKIFESPHLLPIPLSLCEEVPDDALGEEGPHVRGPRLPHHLEVDLEVPLEGDLVHWEEQSVISVDRDGVKDTVLLFM